MRHTLKDDFYKICSEIISENKSIEEWAAVESDDMFQTPGYEGGFDATGMEFCFSVYIDEIEYWFQLALNDIHKINAKIITEVEVTKADL